MQARRLRGLRTRQLPLRGLALLAWSLPGLVVLPAHAAFTRRAIEEELAPWGKGLADLDGDGRLDAVVGGPNLGGRVLWYRACEGPPFELGPVGGGDDLAAADLDGDGDLDVVTNGNPIFWYENPTLPAAGDPTQPWIGHRIDTDRSHDLAVVDVDRDGRPDVAARSAGGPTRIYFQDGPDAWQEVEFSQALPAEGGLALADIDRDGRVDLIGHGYWLEQPEAARSGAAWMRHDFADWPAGGSIAAADLDHDGRIDVSLAASETGPGQLAWFQAPERPETGPWTRHVVDSVEDVHRHHLVDVDDDGERDIVFAEMHQSAGRRVGIYHNRGGGLGFDLELLDDAGSHNVAVGDVGGDGDVDILGANWSLAAPDAGRLVLWRNDRDFRGRARLDAWRYVRLTDEKPDRSFGLTFADMDADGRLDVVSGRSWYRNPGGDLAGPWRRTDLGRDVDAMFALDVDADARPDLIAQGPAGDGRVPLLWLRPADATASRFIATALGSIPADPADGRSQGHALGPRVAGGPPELWMSSVGVHVLGVPSDPARQPWPLGELTDEAREEGIALGDVDRDGDLDLVGILAPGGTTLAWWENPGQGAWPRHDLGSTSGIPADRVALADIDWDARLDLVATESSLTGDGNALYWFRQPADPHEPWPRRTLASGLGSLNSMDVADVDGDGRPDVVAAEHRGALRVMVWRNLDGGTTWLPFEIDTGKESHLGARLADLNGDGARDVVSIAFDAPRDIHLWIVRKVPEPGAGAATSVALLTAAALYRRARAARGADSTRHGST